jgi:hypothetical protein
LLRTLGSFSITSYEVLMYLIEPELGMYVRNLFWQSACGLYFVESLDRYLETQDCSNHLLATISSIAGVGPFETMIQLGQCGMIATYCITIKPLPSSGDI